MVDETVTRMVSAAGASTITTSSKPANDSSANAGKDAAASGQSLPPPAADTAPNIDRIVQSLNEAPAAIGRDLRFQVDVFSGKSVIQVLDQETGELIRQIPPEKVSLFVRAEGDVGLRLLDEVV
jgi:flagellar protein FlaG